MFPISKWLVLSLPLWTLNGEKESNFLNIKFTQYKTQEALKVEGYWVSWLEWICGLFTHSFESFSKKSLEEKLSSSYNNRTLPVFLFLVSLFLPACNANWDLLRHLDNFPFSEWTLLTHVYVCLLPPPTPHQWGRAQAWFGL